jgi:hypothetical protein
MNTVQVIEQCGASLGEDPLTRTIVCKHLCFWANTTIETEVAKITKKVREYTLGTAMILGTDPDHWQAAMNSPKPSLKPTTIFTSGKAATTSVLTWLVILRVLLSQTRSGSHNPTEGDHKLGIQK